MAILLIAYAPLRPGKTIYRPFATLLAMSEIVLKVSLDSTKSSADLFRYFADFTSTNEWDPNTVKTTRINGDGGLGTTYSNTSKFNGKESSLVYEVIEYKPNELIRLRGENKNIVAVDTMSISDNGTSRIFTYEARFKLKGLGNLVAPFLKKAFNKLAEDAKVGLRKVL
jgi:hypothetical protein